MARAQPELAPVEMETSPREGMGEPSLVHGPVLGAPGSIPCSPKGEYLPAPCLGAMEELSARFTPACDLKEP